MKLPYQLLCALAVMMIGFFPHVASAKCMSRTVVNGDGTSGTILAVAPDGASSDLDAAGYKEIGCGTIDKAAYRAKVCNPGAIGNHGVQHQLEFQAGVTFAQLCNTARQEAGLPPQAAAAQSGAGFSPANRRPPVARTGNGMVGPLGGAGTAINQTQGN